MANFVTVASEAAWGALVGHQVSFLWSDGYEEWRLEGKLQRVELDLYPEDPRYPRLYLHIAGYGAHAVWSFSSYRVEVMQ